MAKAVSKPKMNKKLEEATNKALAKIKSLAGNVAVEVNSPVASTNTSEPVNNAANEAVLVASAATKIQSAPSPIQQAKKSVEKTQTPVAPPAQKTQGKSSQQIALSRFLSQIAIYETKTLPQLLEVHGMSPLQFKQVVISEVKRNDKLLKAFIENPASMFASILAGAEIGLIPSEMQGEFFLIPRNLKQANGTYKMTVTPLIGYKGLVKLILRSGSVTKIHTEVVYEGDVFIPTYGLEPDIIHKPDFTVPRTADKIRFVYAVAKKRSGDYQFEVLTREQVLAIKNMSKYDNDLYFNDKQNPNRWMEKKAALIQLSKMLDKDYYSTKGFQLSSMIDGGAYLTLDNDNSSDVKLIEGTPVQPTRFRNIYNSFGKK